MPKKRSQIQQRHHEGVEKSPYSGGNISVDSAPPFMPLEESSNMDKDNKSVLSGNSGTSDDGSSSVPSSSKEKTKTTKSKSKNKDRRSSSTSTKVATVQSRIPKLSGKHLVMLVFGLFVITIVWESFFVDPDERLIQPDFSDKFLLWVESHPSLGLGAICIVIAGAVVSMIPIGTPLVLGCGYIYRGVYGWKLGVIVATVVSMAGSCLGAVICFLLGRYLMRDTVQKWVRKYPLFDAIDVAASKQGLKIMAMLYLTPVLPLGLVSYFCGTTSMKLAHFSVAKVFATPLYIMQTFIGASAHSFIKKKGGKDSGDGGSAAATEQDDEQQEEKEMLVLFGILLSFVMVTLISRHIKKELMKILDQQKKEKTVGDVESSAVAVDGVGSGGVDNDAGTTGDETGLELGLTARRKRGG